MAGTIASPAPASTPAVPLRAPKPAPARKTRGTERFYIVPGEAEWEVWSGTEPASAHLVEKISSPRDTKHSLRALGLPIEDVITLPLWLATTDRSLIAEMVTLQCEKRGILNRARPGNVLDFEVVLQDANESLVRAQLLSPSISQSVCLDQVEQFALNGQFTPLPDNALVITRELGQIAVVVSRQKKLIYATLMGEAELTPATFPRLACLLAVAQTERWGAIREIVLRGSFTRENVSELGSALGLPVRQEDRPTPWPPPSESKLIPQPVQQAHNRRQKQARRQQQLALAAGIYLFAVALWAAYVGWLSFQVNTITKRVKTDAPRVQMLRNTAIRWDAVQPAINPSYYPLEILYRCVAVMPHEGVRLTMFNQKGDHLILTGEASSLRSINKLLDDLKASSDLRGYTWIMPAPRVQANDKVLFRIEGNRPPTHS